MKSIIATTIKDTIKTIDWLNPENNTKAGGLVTKVSKQVKQGDTFTTITFPITSDVEGQKCYEKGNYFAMLPSSTYNSVSYLEAFAPLQFFGYEEGRKKLVYTCPMNLIIWGNMKKIGVTDYNAIDKVIYQITQLLTATAGHRGVDSGRINITDERVTNGVIDLTITNIDIQNASIFSEYSRPPQVEAYTYPYLYTRFQMNTFLTIGKQCLDNITISGEIC